MQSLITYLKSQRIDFTTYDQTDQTIVWIGGQSYELIYGIDGKLFDSDFRLMVEENTECDHYVFKFGGIYYYTPKGTEKKLQLNRLRYVGQSIDILPIDTFLGVRGGYELLNGVNLYDMWVAKAKFLGVKTLGICEKNTLAGALKFQIECNDKGIRPIIGATYAIRKLDDTNYDVKCYVINEEGWMNLLTLNKEINVLNHKHIEESWFLKCSQGLFIVYDPKSLDFEKVPFHSPYTFYQLDTVIYEEDERDMAYLLNLKKYVNSKMQPIAITDAFYCNKEDAYLKIKLNQMSGVREYKSENQYFKSKDEYFEELDNVFHDEQRSFTYFQRAITNEALVADSCQFQISQKGKHLPTYQMTDEEKSKFASNEDLFWDLIIKGMQNKVPIPKHAEYIERINEEVEVIELGGFIDYFLILWDIIKWSNANGILTGVGRGCFLPESLVLTTRGLQQIQNVNIGDCVYGKDSLLNIVENIFRYSINEEIVELTLENGRVIKCTKDHKILTSNRGYICAIDLNEDDNLMELEEGLK